ncbi:DHH family phosphoesterase [Lacticaseibacillus daqingensis]|uniref:DHH family phosphoesterase n=1 Tax=Lacticaseibacillus daqingensis TaxID=2486014 RepID=UPI000F774865|nr:bifunctional oligoribonuclease/PAP phosphatase NrnA [Lacticaseibacillus daqingensis]
MSATLETLLAAFDQYDTIIIHRHLNPDPDAIGAQTGLQAALQAAYPTKTVYAAGPAEPALTWIGPADQVPVAAYADALVVVIDTANIPRIAGDHWQTGKLVMKIDHHPDREPFGDLSYVDTSASSSSEIVADLIAASDRLALDPTVAARLYAGIIGDTGRFLYDLTRPSTHRVAAQLLETGIDAPAIGRRENEWTPPIAKLIGYGLTHVTVSANGAGRLTLDQTTLDELGLTNNDAQRVVGPLGQLSTIQAWAVFTARPDGRYRVELRSKTVSINPLAVAHGGGGHPLASGAIAQDLAECDAIATELDVLLQA